MSKAINAALIDELATELDEVESCVLIGDRGMTVAQVTEFRDTLRSQEFHMRVLKNTLARRSFEKVEMTGVADLLDGPSAVLYGGEGALAISKVVVAEQKKHKGKLVIHGGFDEGAVVDAQGIEALSKVPGRQELLAMIMGAFFGPASELATSMDGLFQEIHGLIEALKEKQG